MSSSRNRRRAFSLVELLAIVAVIGTLLLLLPSCVQQQREAARRMQCTNNLKLLALAVQNYHDSYRSLPPGAESMMASDGFARRVSAFLHLLPYVGETALYEQIMRSNVLPDFNSDTPADASLKRPINTFICPSDGSWGGNGEQAHINYRVCYGDFPVHTANMVGENPGRLGIGPTQICIATRGAFSIQAWPDLSIISDGTSNTILMSERAVGDGHPDVDLKSVYINSGTSLDVRYQNQVIETTADDSTPVDDCMAMTDRLTIRQGNFVTFADYELGGWSGLRWSDGAGAYTGFTTILPPNAPSCLAVNEPTSGGIIAPSSYHGDGVNCAMADGSVRFISNSIDYTGGSKSGYNSFTLEGKSPHGVWGALGTRSGGEEVKDGF